MKTTTRLTAAPLMILGMLAAAPLAFAQTQPTTATEAQAEQQAQQMQQAQQATGAAQQQAQQSQGGGQAMGWADLDVDGDGNISKEEAQRHTGLSSVFDEADTNGDGQLTPDEYRGFIQAQQDAATQN